MTAALEVMAVSKRFGRTAALEGVTVAVETGSAVALLGPNGAGKTTFMRVCATLMRPTSGAVRIFGLDAAHDGRQVRRRIGLLAHESFLYSDLTPTENLLFYARLFRITQPEAQVRGLIERQGLHGWAHRPLRTLSRGLVQRCALARVLLHEPDLIFFDEPFTGLDLEAATSLAEIIREARERGTTIVMSTHDLAHAVALCSSAIVLVAGRVAWSGAVAVDDPAALEARYRALVGDDPAMLAAAS
jgi:heme exporter protein A